jgi:GxxExxY protein
MKPLRSRRFTLSTLKEYPFKDITERIISCAIEVHSSFGPGLLENLYEEALAHELGLRGIQYRRQQELELIYKGKSIGNYRMDFIIENQIILELKCVELIKNIHIAQVLTYLKVENKRVGLIINFNVEKLKDGIKRVIL